MNLIDIAIIIVVAVLAAVLFMSLSDLRRKVSQQQNVIDQLQAQLHASQNEISGMEEAVSEIRAGSLGVGAKVRQLDNTLQDAIAKQEALLEQDPNSRLYVTAAKLIAAGADIEEVMRECELPRAEAELLFSLHKS